MGSVQHRTLSGGQLIASRRRLPKPLAPSVSRHQETNPRMLVIIGAAGNIVVYPTTGMVVVFSSRPPCEDGPSTRSPVITVPGHAANEQCKPSGLPTNNRGPLRYGRR